VTACAERFGVAPERILLTNGMDEGILATSIAALRRSGDDPQGEALLLVPAFDMYAACADAAGGRVVEVAPGPEFTFPLDAVLPAIGPRTRLVFLTTPNNPTGQTIPRSAIVSIAAAAPQALILVDEAYADFAGETLLGDPEVAGLPNVLIGRTFAKAYGLAGLRVGALVGDPRPIDTIRRIVPPYSLNVCATVALRAALDDRAYFDWYLEQVRTSKSLLYDALDHLRIKYWPSAANFVLAHLGDDAKRVVDALAAREVFVRDKSKDAACPGCVRITAGVVEHTRVCIAALEEVM
jgi:histidinol-phosphate aminotransferase